MNTLLRLGVAVLAAIAIHAPAFAQHEGHDHGAPGAPAHDEAAMMEMFMKAATPGEQHAELMSMAGEWTTKVTEYQPGQEPQTSSGTAVYQALLGGRVLQGTYTGTMMGMPMHGMSLDGYDNVTGEYWSTWLDDMGTGIGVMKGHKQADGSVEYAGDMMSPMGPMQMRIIINHVSKNETHMVMYMAMAEMPEFKSMEITYTRKGA